MWDKNIEIIPHITPSWSEGHLEMSTLWIMAIFDEVAWVYGSEVSAVSRVIGFKGRTNATKTKLGPPPCNIVASEVNST